MLGGKSGIGRKLIEVDLDHSIRSSSDQRRLATKLIWIKLLNCLAS